MGAFDIKYIPRTVVKGQVLVNLVAKFTESPIVVGVEKQEFGGEQVSIVSFHGHPSWKLYIDGVANHKGFGVGLFLISPKKITIEKSLRLGFSVMNNETKYEALLVGMTMVQKMGGKVVEIFSNSRLVIGQVQGELEARNPRMQGYLSQVRHLQSGFEFFNLS